MDVKGQRILIFGDSLSKTGSDNSPEIAQITTGSNRVSGQPGDLLGSMLLEAGAEAVQVDARVSRSASNFFGREASQALLNADAAFRPSIVFIILGTNDIGLNMQADAASMTALKEFFENAGAAVWAIGPFTYNDPSLNIGAQPVVDMMKDVFGRRFIDGRPLSVQEGRAGDGVHFGGQAAALTAANMLVEIQSAGGILDVKRSWPGLLIGAVSVLAGAVLFTQWHRGRKALQGLSAKKLTADEELELYERRHKFDHLIREPTPLAIEVAEDYLEEQGLKMSEIVMSPRAADGLKRDLNESGEINLSPWDDPEDNTFVRWTIKPTVPPSAYEKAHGSQYAHVDWQIAHHTPDGSERLWDIPAGYARRAQSPQDMIKRVTADGWAIAKVLKELPPDTKQSDVEKKVVDALYPTEGVTNLVRKPHLFGGLMNNPGYRVAHGLVTRRDGKIVTVRTIVQSSRPLTLKEAEHFRRRYRNDNAWIETMDGTHVPVKGAMRKPAFYDDARPGDLHATMTADYAKPK